MHGWVEIQQDGEYYYYTSTTNTHTHAHINAFITHTDSQAGHQGPSNTLQGEDWASTQGGRHPGTAAASGGPGGAVNSPQLPGRPHEDRCQRCAHFNSQRECGLTSFLYMDITVYFSSLKILICFYLVSFILVFTQFSIFLSEGCNYIILS